MKKRNLPYGLHEIDETDIQAVSEVLRSGSITQGEKVIEFGKAIAQFTGANYAIPVANGTCALQLSVASLDIGPGDEVITTPMTFCATANCVLYQGGSIKFVDIDKNTLNIDPFKIEDQITEKTKAILPVDFRGHPADLSTIYEIAKKYELKVIEDASHSIGSTYKVNNEIFSCGDATHSDFSTFSFHPVKHITTGEGGAVLTNDEELFEKASRLMKHGIDRRSEMFSEADRKGPWYYEMESLGFNFRLNDFQAALGLSQLRKLNDFKTRRREIVAFYNKEFQALDAIDIPFEASGANSNFHIYTIQVTDHASFDRYDLFEYLSNLGYRVMVHYIPVHLLDYYKKTFGYERGDFPISEQYYDRTLSLPLYPSLTNKQVKTVVEDIKNYIL